jgi:GAF domain-containing protein
MSATPDSTLANPEQLIADLQRRLAECRDKAQRNLSETTAERDEALAREAATAEVLGVITSSRGDLAAVFHAILEKARRLCDAAHGDLWTYDDEAMTLAATHGEPEFAAWLLSRGPVPIRPGSVAEHLILGADHVQFEDPAEEQHAAPEFLAQMKRANIRSTLIVPMRKGQEVLGAFHIYRQEVRPFSDKQIALLQNFAAQAVIAMENARLLTETREALEQQTATAEVLQVINSSPGDLAPVFDAMLEKAVRLCEASHGNLYTYDGEFFCTVAVHGDERLMEWLNQIGPFRPTPGQPIAHLLDGGPFLHIADATKEETYRSAPIFREFIDKGGIRSSLIVAMRKDGATLGVITAYRQEVRPFSEKQIALLQNFAAQAVIAMENARLLTETCEALEQQTATAEVLQVINSSPGNLAPVFEAILEKAHSLCGAEYGVLLTYDGELFWPAAMHGAPRWTYPERREGIRPGFGFSGLVRGERFLHIHDMVEVAAQRPDDPVPRALVENGIRTQLAVPLRKDGKLLGIITANRREVKPFSDKQVALLENFAAQAVIAMENARLLTETGEALEQQTATAEVLQVINSSPADLAPVFDAMLEKAMRLCEADFGILNTYDGERFHRAAARGEPPAHTEWRLARPTISGPGTGHARIVAGVDVVHTLDLKAEAPYRDGDPDRRAFVDLAGARTGLIVALRKEGTLLGTIRIFRQEVRPFTEKQIALLQNFAAQAVIAMENARLLDELRQRTNQVAELNRGLEARVAEQVEELGRVGRLKRFLAPQLAELIVSQGDEKILESHRREIVVVFCDVRGYTAFTETAEPEEVLDFLREYHGALGPLVSQFEGTLDQFSGDGIMVFFNDPVPCPNPAERGVKMAMAMREAAGTLIASWRRRGRLLGFGAGIAQGYATLGQIGFAERSGYTAIGTVCNLAARLCAEAQDGQILVGQRVAVAVEETITLEEVGALTLKGLTQPVVAYNVPLAPIQPALRVIEGGPQSV